MAESLKELKHEIDLLREWMNELNTKITEVALKARNINQKIRKLIVDGGKTTGDPVADLALISSWDAEMETDFRALRTRFSRETLGALVVVMRRERGLGITYETFAVGKLENSEIAIFPKEERFEIATGKHFLATAGYTRNIEVLPKGISVSGSDFDKVKILLGEEAVEWVERSPREIGLYDLLVRKAPKPKMAK